MKMPLLFIFGILLISSILQANPYQKSSLNPHKLESAKTIPFEEEIVKMEVALIEIVNDQRAKFRYKSLSISSKLSALAKQHSYNMAQGQVTFGHEGFEDRAQEIRRHGWHQAFGENVAYLHHVGNPLLEALKCWMKSQSHRANILGDFDETGVGIAYDIHGKCFITQLFAKRR